MFENRGKWTLLLLRKVSIPTRHKWPKCLSDQNVSEKKTAAVSETATSNDWEVISHRARGTVQIFARRQAHCKPLLRHTARVDIIYWFFHYHNITIITINLLITSELQFWLFCWKVRNWRFGLQTRLNSRDPKGLTGHKQQRSSKQFHSTMVDWETNHSTMLN